MTPQILLSMEENNIYLIEYTFQVISTTEN